jgi:hypothetical protein
MIGIGAAILVAPWVARLVQGFTLGIRGSDGRYAADYYSLARLGTAMDHPALVPLAAVTAIGVVLALVSRAPLIGLLAAWGALLYVGSNPHWHRIPGAGALDSVTVVSSLYAVGALAIGYIAQRVWDMRPAGLDPYALPNPERNRAQRYALPISPQRLRQLTLVAACALLVGLGALQLPPLVRPQQVLAADGDIKAARWIAKALPSDARLLVNASIVDWEPDFVEPTDGGAWLPLLARRGTTLLPLVYAGERGAAAADIDRMERIARAARADPAAPATLDLLRENGVTHVYLGVYGGPIDENRLAASPAYRRVYAADGAAIYELVGGRGT